MVFRYWKVTTVGGSKNSATEYTRCYADEFNFALFQDAIVESVYTAQKDSSDVFNASAQQKADEELGVTITFMENSRNQYNDNQSGTGMTNSRKVQGDRMYTDFLLSFNNVAREAGTNNVQQLNLIGSDKKRCGLIIESVGNITLEDGKYITESDEVYKERYGDTLASISEKLSGKDTTVDKANDLREFIAGESNPSGTIKSEFDVSELDNKNRLQYFYSIVNRSHSNLSVSDNRYRVFRAYAYIADVVKNGSNYTYSNIEISNKPVYFTIYDMASIQNYAEANASGGLQ